MASKTIDSLVTFVPITNYKIDINEFTCLRVKACYDKGYGFRAGFVPAWGNEYCWGCCVDGSDNPLTAGMCVDVEPAKKNNAKRLMEIIGNLGKAKEIIAALFDDRQWDKLRGVLHNVGRYGYTDAFRQQAEKMLREREAKSETTEQKSNNSNSETMEKKMKAADLIGKTIVNGNMKYVVIEAIDDEKIKVEFTSGDRAPVAMPMRVEQVDKLLAGGWKIDADKSASEKGTVNSEKFATAAEDVEEVEDIKPEKPKAKTVKMDEPKAKTEKSKGKQEKPKAEKPKADGKLVYSTYTNKKGKTCAKISGFKDDDAVYQSASELHGSASYERGKDGSKTFYLVFGPRYVTAAKDMCAALNAGKTLSDCKSIVDKATEERAQQREELKQKREEHKAEKREGKVYTEQEVVELVERIIAGDKAAMDELNAMRKAA